MSRASSTIAPLLIMVHHLFVGVLLGGGGVLAAVWHAGTWKMPPSLQGIDAVLQGAAAWPIAVLMVLLAGAHCACAYGLWSARSIGRSMALLLAVLHLPLAPVGTAVAVLTFWTFAKRDAMLPDPEEADRERARAHNSARLGCLVLVVTLFAGLSVVGGVAYVVFAAVQNIMETLEGHANGTSTGSSTSGGITNFLSEYEELQRKASAAQKLNEAMQSGADLEGALKSLQNVGSNLPSMTSPGGGDGAVLQPVPSSKAAPQSEDEHRGTWRYVDDRGQMHIVDHYLKVPAAHRKNAERLHLE